MTWLIKKEQIRQEVVVVIRVLLGRISGKMLNQNNEHVNGKNLNNKMTFPMFKPTFVVYICNGKNV